MTTKKIRYATVWNGKTFVDVELPTGVAVVVHSANGKRLAGAAVMAYIGGRGRRGGCRRQITKRFNPDKFLSMLDCVEAAIKWRRKAERTITKFTNANYTNP